MQKMNYSSDVTKLATVPQAIERYKISRNTLMKYAYENNAVVNFGRSVRINIDAMDSFIDGAKNKDSANASDIKD